MSNPLFSALGGNRQMNGTTQMIQQFQQFRNTLNGNPKDMVMQMLNSGRVSQADLNRAQSFAKQFQSLLK